MKYGQVFYYKNKKWAFLRDHNGLWFSYPLSKGYTKLRYIDCDLVEKITEVIVEIE